MPSPKKTETISSEKSDSGSMSGWSCCGKSDTHFGKKILFTLTGVLLVYLTLYVGVLMRDGIKKYKYIGMADQVERTITVAGFGKVTGKNDLAVTTVGYSNTDKEVAKAQAENKRVMDQVSAALKKLGVAEGDLQNDYSIYPDYNYTQNSGQQFIGYRVTNNVTVKIRDLSKISDVLSLPGLYGATSVGGLSFTIDDPENLKAMARDKALADAKAKAQRLAGALGARLVEVVAYSEYESGGVDYPMMRSLEAAATGGSGPAPAAISSGSKDVTLNVNITYKIVTP